MESNKMARHCFLENANIKSKRNSGWTLLSWGAETDCKAVVKLLDKNVNVEFKNNSGRLPLSQAARGSIETAT
jgi:ankyrin repeat protein